MKANIGKYNFLSSLETISKMTVENFAIKNSGSQKILGVTIGRNLNFKEHASNLCKNISMKTAALARNFSNMSFQQRTNLMRAYLMSRFGYYPLFWMNQSRSLNKSINILHERALHFV